MVISFFGITCISKLNCKCCWNSVSHRELCYIFPLQFLTASDNVEIVLCNRLTDLKDPTLQPVCKQCKNNQPILNSSQISYMTFSSYYFNIHILAIIISIFILYSNYFNFYISTILTVSSYIFIWLSLYFPHKIKGA